MKEKQIDVTGKNYDTVFKEALFRYREEMVKFLKINCPEIIGIEPTELPEIEAYTNNTDFIFKLADNTLLHFEFQSSYDRKDIERFMMYDTRLYLKERKTIRTILVCKESEKIKEEIKAGVFNYKVEVKQLKGYIAEKVLIKKNPNYAELMFSPLMDGEMKISDRIKKAIERFKEREQDSRKVIDFTAAILVLSNRIISFEEFKRIWEEIKVLNIIKYAEEIGMEKGLEQGLEQGLEKGIKEGLEGMLDIKFGTTEIMGKIVGINDIAKLESLKEVIKRAKSIEDVERAI